MYMHVFIVSYVTKEKVTQCILGFILSLSPFQYCLFHIDSNTTLQIQSFPLTTDERLP